ncbi:protease [Sphingomonas sp. Leaf17]|uniref:rhomboid family intramembrane serine protease n=1 Tax=Sphingomonas sp. Leaf17 TaxID=1735683 RepID=UPI0006FDEDAB|nr:rhomboid family intramembrane serine protease [Sphingomonas sp. Leaf17]KQM65081.1 protease [Sphingomonas sp. Leaf17]
MRFADAPATIVIAAITVVASVGVFLSGSLPYAAIAGGFIPVRFDASVMAGEMPWLMPAWLTPLTATLLHGGAAHLALNMVMLVFCGVLTERAIGARGMVLLYVAGAYAAALVQWAIGPLSDVPMIGASGAISAIVAAHAISYGQARTRSFGPISANMLHVVWLAAGWIGIQTLIGLAGMAGGDGVVVAIGAHIGGFIVGLALAKPLLLWRYRGA